MGVLILACGGTLARVPYLSDIQHRRVIEPNGSEVAKLSDLAVVPQGQFPAVQWAILATPGGETKLPDTYNLANTTPNSPSPSTTSTSAR